MSRLGFSRKRPASPSGAPAPNPAAEVMQMAAQRINDIVAAAERAVNDITAATDLNLRKPGSPGGQTVEADLADSLVNRVGLLRDESRQIASVLDRASVRLGATSAPPPSPPAPKRGRSKSKFSGRFGSPGTRPAPTEESLKLFATQMAVAGSPREDIETRLREEFGVEDPYSIVEATHAPSRASTS